MSICCPIRNRRLISSYRSRLLVMLEWSEWDKVATEEANEGRGMPNLIRPSSHHRTSSRAAELGSRYIVNIVGIGYVATTSDLSWLLEHRFNHHRRRWRRKGHQLNLARYRDYTVVRRAKNNNHGWWWWRLAANRRCVQATTTELVHLRDQSTTRKYVEISIRVDGGAGGKRRGGTWGECWTLSTHWLVTAGQVFSGDDLTLYYMIADTHTAGRQHVQR